MTRVPFVDLSAMNREAGPELNRAVENVITSCQFASGPPVQDFEEAFADYLGSYHCIGVNSGTSALHLALLACEIGPGDEVITTPLTWISSSWAISYVGATPVFVDIDAESYNLDASQVEAAITPRTKAILPVHLYGRAADLGALETIARRHNLLIIEDAAQAHGARWANQYVGTVGRVGCFSFYPSKNLGAFGEAGAVVTDDPDIARRIRALRDHAQTDRHRHVEIGYNARMDSLQAAVLLVKLKWLDRWNERRRQHAKVYQASLSAIEGLRLPATPEAPAHVWHLFVVLSEVHSRDRIADYLKHQQIGVSVHYPYLVPEQPAYQHLGYTPGSLPVAEHVARHCLSLPMYPHLTENQIAEVCHHLRLCATQGVPAYS